MRLSLKLLLLLTALSAVVVGWLHAVSVSRNAQHSGAANSSLQAELIREAVGSSVIRVDQNGDVRSLNLAGPNGYSALARFSNAGDSVDQVSLTSKYAFDHFDPEAFPSVKKLLLADFPIDTLDLGLISQLERVTMLALHTNGPPAITVLSTLPKDNAIRAIEVLSTEPGDLSAFPILPNLRSLVINVPSLPQAELDKLRRRLPDCEVFYRDP